MPDDDRPFEGVEVCVDTPTDFLPQLVNGCWMVGTMDEPLCGYCSHRRYDTPGPKYQLCDVRPGMLKTHSCRSFEMMPGSRG